MSEANKLAQELDKTTDPMWERLFQPLLAEPDPPNRMGRPRADQRRCLGGMIYRARTG